MNKLKNLKTSLAFVCALLSAPFAFAETAIVVNPDNPVSEIDMEGVKNIYLGKTKRYPGGNVAIPVDHKADDGPRSSFNDTVLGKNSSQLKSYWAQRIFTGKGQPPKQVNGDAEVLKLVAQNPAIIGYVDAASVDDTVKVILKF